MLDASWEQAISELERASEVLIAALPADTVLIDDALGRRETAIRKIKTLAALPDKEQFARLQKAAEFGDAAVQQLLVAREQLRDNIARLNHASFLGHAFAANPADSRKSLDCEG